jgi:hypothetical protein
MAKQSKSQSAAAAKAIADAKPPEAAPAFEAAGDKGVVVLVAGPAAGRMRAGRSFGPEPVEIDLGDISRDDFARIAGDPELRVSAKPADADEAEQA